MREIKSKLKPSLSYMLNFRNLEFFDTVNNIFRVVEDSDIESESVRSHIISLMQYKEQYETLVNSSRKHANTKLINENVATARVYLIIIRNTIDNLQKLLGGSQHDLILRLKLWIAPVREFMNSKSKTKQAYAIAVMANEYINDDSVKMAVKEFGLNAPFESVVKINSETTNLKLNRNNEVGRLKDMRKNFREDIVFTLELLTYSLISEVKLNGSEATKCYEMCYLINSIVADGRTIQKSLETQKQNSDNRELDNADETDTTKSEAAEPSAEEAATVSDEPVFIEYTNQETSQKIDTDGSTEHFIDVSTVDKTETDLTNEGTTPNEKSVINKEPAYYNNHITTEDTGDEEPTDKMKGNDDS